MWASRSEPFQEDMAFQLRDWRAERVGWCVMGILVILACLGLFSNGPLSKTTARDETRRLSVEHERFYRFGASSDMRWSVEAAPGTETTIAVNREFIEAFTLESITPAPSRMVGTADGVRLTFTREEGASLDVVLSVTPDEVGTVAPEVRLQDAEPIRLDTFIYP
jgi:hypothetical protein